MYNRLNCIETLANTGQVSCLDNLGYDARLLVTLESFSFASEADAKNLGKYTDAINERKMFPFPMFKIVEPAVEDNVIQETGLGIRIFVREGKYGGLGKYRVALCNLVKLRTFNNLKLRAFIITGNDKIYGTSPDGVEFKGFTLSEFFQSGLEGSDGTTARMASLKYQMESTSEMFDYPAVPVLSWSPLAELSGLIDVTVTSTAIADPSITVTVTQDCDNLPVVGLVQGDFTVLNSSGAEQLPADSFVNNLDGTYTFTFNSLPIDLYTVNLKTPANQLTGGYQSDSAATFGAAGLWNLPSRDELLAMYDNLKLFGVGNFETAAGSNYWNSSENNNNTAWGTDFSNRVTLSNLKTLATYNVRASRSFAAPSGSYSLRDVGPGGGLVYYIDNTTHYEAGANDISTGYLWSNVGNTLIGTTGLTIGDGAQNTLDIINQAGHTTSAAKLCNDLN